jgi:hypothetical protein
MAEGELEDAIRTILETPRPAPQWRRTRVWVTDELVRELAAVVRERLMVLEAEVAILNQALEVMDGRK